MAQLNYQLIAQDARMHRSIAQRIISEMLQRVAMNIVAGANLKVMQLKTLQLPIT